MGFFGTLIYSVGLAMDACAVGMANGMTDVKMPVKRVLLIGLFFGFFQFLMPLIGYYITGIIASAFLETFKRISAWISFSLLAFLGGKMLYEGIEEWIFCMFRLLAGAYKREYNFSLEEAGLAFDFYPYTKDGNEVSRKERREKDCIMAIRMLMRSPKGEFLGGVYTLLLHRKEIEKFAKSLRQEYDKVFVKRVHGRGECLFAGVSPLGYTGCNYWYYDPSGKTKQGDHVWVEMGSHNTKQIVFVDSVRYFTKETAPYDVDIVKEVLGIASDEEYRAYRKEEN